MLVQAGCWCQFSATKKTSQSTLNFAGYVIVCVCVCVCVCECVWFHCSQESGCRLCCV